MTRFLARFGKRGVALLYDLRIDGRLTAPGMVCPEWLTEGMTVWVREERLRIGQQIGEGFVFDGRLDCRVHRPREWQVLRALPMVVERVDPTYRGTDGLIGVVHLRTSP